MLLVVPDVLCFFTGCFVPSTINDEPKNLGQTDDKIISDMRKEGLNKPKPFYLNEISSKAMRSFVSSFWNATDPTWVKYSDGYVVYFLRDGIHHKVYYSTAGDVQCIIRQFSADEMPGEIRHLIESAYVDYSIILACEVTSRNKTRFEIKIEDVASFKEIKIDDKGLQEVNTFNKSR